MRMELPRLEAPVEMWEHNGAQVIKFDSTSYEVFDGSNFTIYLITPDMTPEQLAYIETAVGHL